MIDSEMTTVVNALADKIGVAAESLAPVAETLMREMRLYGLVSVLASFVVLFVFRWLSRDLHRRADRMSDSTDSAMVHAVSVVVNIGGVVGCLVTLFGGLTALTRPTFAVLHGLL